MALDCFDTFGGRAVRVLLMTDDGTFLRNFPSSMIDMESTASPFSSSSHTCYGAAATAVLVRAAALLLPQSSYVLRRCCYRSPRTCYGSTATAVRATAVRAPSLQQSCKGTFYSSTSSKHTHLSRPLSPIAVSHCSFVHVLELDPALRRMPTTRSPVVSSQVRSQEPEVRSQLLYHQE